MTVYQGIIKSGVERLRWNRSAKVQLLLCSPNYIYEVEKETFNVVKEELEILQPNIVLFLSGSYYDGKLKNVLGEIKYSPLPNYRERQLSKLDISGIDFAFRTYHPNYLFRNNINSYFEMMINDIKF